MDHKALTNAIRTVIDPLHLNGWEAEELAVDLAGLADRDQRAIIGQIPAVWPVSHSLCFNFFAYVGKVLPNLDHSQLDDWVKCLLHAYETGGLLQARQFMDDVEGQYLCRLRGESSLQLDSVSSRLRIYARGLTGTSVDIAPGKNACTDGRTIYLPVELRTFKNISDNFLVYKLMVSYQCAYLIIGTYNVRLTAEDPLIQQVLNDSGQRPLITDDNDSLLTFFSLFSDSKLIEDLYFLTETIRATRYLSKELPGLMRDTTSIRQTLTAQRTRKHSGEGISDAVELVKHLAFDVGQELPSGWSKNLPASQLMRRIGQFSRQAANSYHSLQEATELYLLLQTFGGTYQATAPLAYQGSLALQAYHQTRLQQREATKNRFVEALAALLAHSSTDKESSASPPDPGETGGTGATESDQGILIPPFSVTEEKESKAKDPHRSTPEHYLIINDSQIVLPDELLALQREIQADLGQVPDTYISSAAGKAGTAISGGAGPTNDSAEPAGGPLVFDEWDYRRNGFRKNWCTLLEKELQPVRSSFVADTLRTYKGVRRRLRHQFEMLRSQHRFLKRQPEGDDIDLDGLFDALSDKMAGLPPSENIFIRLSRHDRDIAAVFLVDMSSSTEGWINKALKESLVLLCEALEILGDRYAIYGFSGMRRARCEFYHIKHFNEANEDSVINRIAAIVPKEYTRMGPPIRYASRLLSETDAKLRLLITLSDGKPEDYDDYKGEYAIEDTRHALIEAKTAGIHPFCITIDRKAHDYISHMYGEVNYIFVNDINRLPVRIPEIYRNLTT